MSGGFALTTTVAGRGHFAHHLRRALSSRYSNGSCRASCLHIGRDEQGGRVSARCQERRDLGRRRSCPFHVGPFSWSFARIWSPCVERQFPSSSQWQILCEPYNSFGQRVQRAGDTRLYTVLCRLPRDSGAICQQSVRRRASCFRERPAETACKGSGQPGARLVRRSSSRHRSFPPFQSTP